MSSLDLSSLADGHASQLNYKSRNEINLALGPALRPTAARRSLVPCRGDLRVAPGTIARSAATWQSQLSSRILREDCPDESTLSKTACQHSYRAFGKPKGSQWRLDRRTVEEATRGSWTEESQIEGAPTVPRVQGAWLCRRRTGDGLRTPPLSATTCRQRNMTARAAVISWGQLRAAYLLPCFFRRLRKR